MQCKVESGTQVKSSAKPGAPLTLIPDRFFRVRDQTGQAQSNSVKPMGLDAFARVRLYSRIRLGKAMFTEGNEGNGASPHNSLFPSFPSAKSDPKIQPNRALSCLIKPYRTDFKHFFMPDSSLAWSQPAGAVHAGPGLRLCALKMAPICAIDTFGRPAIFSRSDHGWTVEEGVLLPENLAT
jgi:hypothetical protein